MDKKPIFFHIIPMEFPKLELKQCGTQKCLPENSYGPAIRDIYLLHYIISGKGSFDDGKNNYELNAGDLFLICPGASTYYRADKEDPWKYTWIGFSGNSAYPLLHKIGLSAKTPILHVPECASFFTDIETECSISKENNPYSNSLFILGKLAEIFSHLSNCATPQTYDFSDLIIDFFTNNISSTISISQLAENYGFSRAYFSMLFKKETGYSPKQYLLNLRMEKARCLLLDTYLDITCIAHSVGYEDPLLFSKQFKKKYGHSPRHLRNNARKPTDNVKEEEK